VSWLEQGLGPLQPLSFWDSAKKEASKPVISCVFQDSQNIKKTLLWGRERKEGERERELTTSMPPLLP